MIHLANASLSIINAAVGLQFFNVTTTDGLCIYALTAHGKVLELSLCVC